MRGGRSLAKGALLKRSRPLGCDVRGCERSSYIFFFNSQRLSGTLDANVVRRLTGKIVVNYSCLINFS